MSLLDYCEIKGMLEAIALERGQYCYDYAKTLEAERDALKARVGKLEQVLREVASPPYHDSDLASLLETLRVRAKAALDEDGGGLTSPRR